MIVTANRSVCTIGKADARDNGETLAVAGECIDEALMPKPSAVWTSEQLIAQPFFKISFSNFLRLITQHAHSKPDGTASVTAL